MNERRAAVGVASLMSGLQACVPISRSQVWPESDFVDDGA